MLFASCASLDPTPFQSQENHKYGYRVGPGKGPGPDSYIETYTANSATPEELVKPMAVVAAFNYCRQKNFKGLDFVSASAKSEKLTNGVMEFLVLNSESNQVSLPFQCKSGASNAAVAITDACSSIIDALKKHWLMGSRSEDNPYMPKTCQEKWVTEEMQKKAMASTPVPSPAPAKETTVWPSNYEER